jgi:cell division protease FtsH
MTAWEGEDGRGTPNTAVSEEKELAIDSEVTKLCDEAYNTTMKTLSAHRDLLDELSARLIERETLDGFEINEIILKMTGKPPATAFDPIPVKVESDLPTGAKL